jgi:eukaryotic-like serine/threonine-protein kinase
MNDETLFHLALEKPVGERSAFLDRECAGDANLRRRVEILLRSHETPDSFLAGPAADPGVMEEFGQGLTADAGPDRPDGQVSIRKSPAEGPGDQIGPYKLLQQLGEGGMGTVFMAEQARPVRRKVALKIIKLGMDSLQVIARFEAERQALAMMDHVNIARVFDAGTTESGRPYFVMELIHGVPITKYCDDNQLSPRQRLELFVPVCQAIQHAHQKGIIHRDIKPSNVLVTLYDGKPVAKVIDFGVAKATEQSLTERTLFTQYGTLVGTLEYMSPEQAEMSALGVDTRSDIYSLGVLLYELLTGSTPLGSKQMKRAAYAEILRMIKEVEPPKPSTRLSDSGETLASISAQRHMEPAKLTKLVRGELDWIVMKTLEKDRNRRYETAIGLAADVQRYLDDEPVQACPPSIRYRFRKFARRNKSGLAVAGLVLGFLTLLGGGAGWVLGDRSTRAAAASSEVVQALGESEQLYRQGKLPEAVQASRKARGLLQFGGGNDELRKRVGDRLSDLVMAERLEEARLRGAAVNAVSRFDVDATATAYNEAFREYGIPVETLETAEAASRIRRRFIRDDLTAALDHWAALSVVAPLLRSRLIAITTAADVDEWRSQVRAAAEGDLPTLKKLADSPEALNQHASSSMLLGHSLFRLGDPEAAVRLFQKAQRRHPGDFWINVNLASFLMYGNRPRLDEAIRFLTAAVALRPESPGAHFKLGRALTRKGSPDEAMAAYREAIRLQPSFGQAHLQLGLRLMVGQDFEGAVVAVSRAVELVPKDVGIRVTRGHAYLKLGRHDRALADFSTASGLDPDDPRPWVGRGDTYAALEQWSKAVAEYSKAIEAKPAFSIGWSRRGDAYIKLDRADRAVTDFSRAIELDPKNRSNWSARANAYHQLSRWDDALADFSKLIEFQPEFDVYRIRRGQIYFRMSRWDKALADLTVAIELKPDSGVAWQYRGYAYAECGRWKEAASDLMKLVAMEPATASHAAASYWDNAAVAHLGAGDTQAYRAACAAILERFEKTHDPAIAGRVVATLVACPEAVDDPARLVPLAELACSVNREWNTGRLGAAYYRAGKFSAVLDCFLARSRTIPPAAGDLLFMAMAHDRLGQADEARTCLDLADRWIAAAGRSRASEERRTGPTWDNWREEIAAQVLRREAATLMNVADDKP